MATLTVGTGKTYSTPDNAIGATSATDTVELYYNQDGSGTYTISATPAHPITIRAMQPGIQLLGKIQPGHSSGTLLLEDLNIQMVGSVIWSTAGAVTYSRCNILAAKGAYWYPSAASAGRLRFQNCIIHSNPESTLPVIYPYGSVVDFYNCTIVSRNSQDAIQKSTGCVVNIYNCMFFLFAAEAVVDMATNVNMDYCIANVTAGVYGSNSLERTPTAAGLVAYASGATPGSGFDYRTLEASEVTGTQTANGVDLTAAYTTDIGGRTRSTYAIGATEGFQIYADPDYPDRANVLSDDTVNGLAGLFANIAAGNVKTGEQWGENGTEFTGSYGGGGGGSAPTTPTVIFVDNDDGTVTATVSGADTGTTNTIYTAVLGASGWTTHGSVVGDGDVVCTVSAVLHIGYCVSVSGEGMSATTPVALIVADSGTPAGQIRTILRAALVADENIQSLLAANDAIYFGAPAHAASLPCITIAIEERGDVEFDEPGVFDCCVTVSCWSETETANDALAERINILLAGQTFDTSGWRLRRVVAARAESLDVGRRTVSGGAIVERRLGFTMRALRSGA